MKKLVSLFVPLLIISLLFTNIAYADQLTTASAYDEADEAITLTNDLKDNSGITVNQSSRTITLKNVNLTGSTTDDVLSIISNDGKDVKIKIVGTNNINITTKADDAYAIYSNASLVFAGTGSLTINGINGINSKKNINIKTPKIIINKSVSECITAKTGTIKIGSSARVSCNTSAKSNAKKNYYPYVIRAKKMSNNYKSLVTANGKVPVGSLIHSKAAVYKVKSNGNIALKSWLSGKHAKFTDYLKYNVMGFSYTLDEIMNGAFNNKAGSKLKKLTINTNTNAELLKINKYAFKGTKNLTDVYTKLNCCSDASLIEYYTNGSARTAAGTFLFGEGVGKCSTVNSKAFSGAGKSSGVTVHVLANDKMKGSDGKYHNVCLLVHDNSKNAEVNILKSNLLKCGFKSNTKVVANKYLINAEYF